MREAERFQGNLAKDYDISGDSDGQAFEDDAVCVEIESHAWIVDVIWCGKFAKSV